MDWRVTIMATIDPEDLERLIEDAGVSNRAAGQLRRANQPDAERPAGHGAPSPLRLEVEDL
jgi:anti-sigma regulatory factor (Ser/Thr protein kinase)